MIDANEAVVGRLAAQIAPILMGKHRPTYTAHIDTGDYVIVTNVDKVVFTGNKWQQKSYQRYSGHPGGQKDEQAWKLFQRHPDRILRLAIQRMMPKNKIGRHMMSKLKLYSGTVHEHQAQSPIPLPAIKGRPSASGAIYTVKPTPKARPERRPKPEVVETTPAPVAEITEPQLPPPVEAHEAQLPPPSQVTGPEATAEPAPTATVEHPTEPTGE